MLKSRPQIIFDRQTLALPVLLLSLTAFFLLPAVAPASNIGINRGIGTRAMAMGGAFTAVADDPFAVYYNPAGLAQVEGNKFYVEYMAVLPRVYLQRGNGSREVFMDKGTKGPLVGVSCDFSKTLQVLPRFVWAFNLFLPDNTKSGWKVRYSGSGGRFDPYFPAYGDGHEGHGVGIWAGAGMQIFPWLMVGAGFDFLIHAPNMSFNFVVTPDIKLTDGQLQFFRLLQEELTMDFYVTTEIAPMAAVLIKPFSNLRVGFLWRECGKIELGGGGGIAATASIRLGEDLLIPVPVDFTIPFQLHYRPVLYDFGVAYQPRDDLLVAVDLDYYDWSGYTDGAGRMPDPPLKGILIPRLGVEYQMLEKLVLRGGYYFYQSPLSQQKAGYSLNFIDNDVHSISFGLGYTWQVFGFPKKPAGLSAVYQFQILAPRSFHNVHPGEADLKSSGYFHSFGLGLEFHL